MDGSINHQYERNRAQDIPNIVKMEDDQSHAEGDKKWKGDRQGPWPQRAERQSYAKAKGHVTAGKEPVRRPKVEHAIQVRQKDRDEQCHQGAQEKAAFRGDIGREEKRQENHRHEMGIVVGQESGHGDSGTFPFFL
jgi:hypothetical protein